jgi:GNAT superfamily N-acetyltransferase
MSLEIALQEFPKEHTLKDGSKCRFRLLRKDDAMSFHEFFLDTPAQERLFIKHRVTELGVIEDWCHNIDLGRNLPLLAVSDGRILGAATLHQQLGGWKRHIGRLSVLVHPAHRNRGLARGLIAEMLEIARHIGLEKAEAEFVGEQEAASRMFGLMGFKQLLRRDDYVKDMQANTHDYILMGLDLKTDEEYAGMG